MTPVRRCGISIAAIVALALVGAAPALASTHTWIGPTNGTWSNAANWSEGSKPTSGEPGGTVVVFGSNTTSSMDIPGLVVDEVRFTGANNTIKGTTGLTISGSTLIVNIASEGAGNTLATTLPLAMTGAPVEATSSTGTLTLAGAIGGSDGLVFVGTGGSLTLTASNTYTGPTTVASGALHIGTTVGYVIVGSSLTIGTGVGAGAELADDNSSDIDPETPVTVNSNGVFNLNSHIDTAKSLTVNGGQVVGANLTMTGALAVKEGTVTIAGFLWAGSVSMAGGTISGPGQLTLSGNVEATSAPSGPATLASSVQLKASPTVTVGAGTAPEFLLTGAVTETGGSRSVTKAGAGTMLMSGENTYTGMTTVSAGTLVADGSQAGPISVGENGTLEGSGTVGSTTIAGTLAPTAPGLHTSSLSFGATGRLDVTLTSVVAALVPSTIVSGPVAIDPSAALNLVVAPATALPHGSSPVLIDDAGSEPIGGQFSGIPNNFVFMAEGVPLVVSYAGGDGNDLSLTAGNVAPQISSIAATPNPTAVGQPVAMSVAGSDANQDALTTTWNFGDGTTGTGPATSHAYATPGAYTVVANVSDGLAEVHSTAVITVTGTTTGGGGATPTGTAPATTSTVTSSAYGDDFGLTAPAVCVRNGASFTVSLSIKKLTSGRAHGNVLVKVTRVVFAVGGKTVKTVRSAPFRAHLSVPRSALSGSAIKVRAKAYLRVHGGKLHAKSITVTVRAC